MSEAEASAEDGEEAGRADPSGATAAPPGGAGFRFRDSVGFVRDESHPRWAAETDGGEEGEDEEEGGEEKGDRNRPDDEENPGNLGPITRGWSDAERARAIEGSPFMTPTVPLKLRRAVYTNDMETVRAMINRWTSADTSGDSDVDSMSRRYATAVFDEHSRDTLLHVAVRKRYAEMVRYLVAQGARRSAVNRRNQTPLSIAATMLKALKGWDDYPIAMEISGHPNRSVDGLYTQRGEHAGFPRYANQHGIHLWHNQPSGAWLIHVEFTPDSDLCLAGFGGSPEAVPAGTRHKWLCAASANEVAAGAESILEGFQQRIDAASDYAKKTAIDEERNRYLERLESTGGRYAERVLAIVQLDEAGLRNATESIRKPKGARLFRGKSYDQAYEEHEPAELTKRVAQSAARRRQRQRPRRAPQADDVPSRLPGLTLSERRMLGAEARAHAKLVVKALRGCFAQFQTSNFAAGDAPWPVPESAWAGGPPDGEPHPAWADNDPISIKMNPHPDRMADCTAKPGGWPDEMKHRMEQGKRQPVRVAALPGLLPADTAGRAATDKVLQRPMRDRLAKAHSTPKKWASVNHTVRSQIGQHHAQAYESLVGSIQERKRTPGWLQKTERSFHRAHSSIPVETRGGWR
jgi:hypothetical protein